MATGERHPHDSHGRVITRLRMQAEDVERLTSGLDEDALARRLAHGQWSLKELVCHLWRIQEVIEGRLEAMLTRVNPPIPPYLSGNDAEFEEKLKSPAAELVAAFLTEREQLLTLLESLSAGDWRRSGSHPEYPHYDVQFQMELMVHHEAHHVYQIFQRRAGVSGLAR